MNNKLRIMLSLMLALTLVMGGVASAATMVFYDATDKVVYDDTMTDLELEQLIAAYVGGNELAKVVNGKLINYAAYRDAMVQVIADAKADGKTDSEAMAMAIDAQPGIVAGLPEVPVESPVVPQERWFISLDTTAPDDTIIADGDDNTTVKISIVDENGDVVPVNGIVIELSTSHGSLASAAKKQRVTLQDGVGTAKLNSEFSATPIVAELTAKLFEASQEYKDAIGTKEVIFNVFFQPLGVGTLTAPPVLIAAESNQADRVTLFFDKDVDIENLEKGLAAADEDEFMALDFGFWAEVYQDATGDDHDIIGYLPVIGNNKAVVAVIDVDENDVEPLIDNTWTQVRSATYSDYGWTNNMIEFLLTDARQPELVAVEVFEDSLNHIVLEFSESIYLIDTIRINGGIINVLGWEARDFIPADWDIDDNFNPAEDNRHFVDVYIDGWLDDGLHSVTVSKVSDWAGFSDPKNVSTTQTLDFTIGENVDEPTVEVVVESPEQIRMTFPLYVEMIDEEYGTNWMLEYNDGTVAVPNWVTVLPGLISTFNSSTGYPEVNQVVLEAVEDWTDYFDTATSGVNYYNFPFRLHADADLLVNARNGVKNEELNISLNYPGSPLNSEDTRSAQLVEVTQTDEDVYVFDIEMDEPIKYRGTEDGIDSPSEEQGSDIPVVVVEFIGRDSDGNLVTINGEVRGYGDEYSHDKVITIGEIVAGTLQGHVDDDDYEEAWTLNVKNITDDVGNSSNTVVYPFTVTKTEDTVTPEDLEFWVESAEWNTDGNIVVQFTDLVLTAGGAQNAINLSNYSVSNQDWPEGTNVIVDMTSGDTLGGQDGYTRVIIVLGDDVNWGPSSTLEVAKTLVSKNGNPLLGFEGYAPYARYQDVIQGPMIP